LPIRHPLDCAVSNLNTGHVRFFHGLNNDSSIYDVVQAVLDEIFWFADLKSKYPNRFFYFLGQDISKEMLINLSEFVQLNPDEVWIENAISVMMIKSKYSHSNDLIRFYRDYVNDKGSRFPNLSKGLLSFTE